MKTLLQIAADIYNLGCREYGDRRCKAVYTTISNDLLEIDKQLKKGENSILIKKLMAANRYGNEKAAHNIRLIQFVQKQPCTCHPNGTFNKCPRCRALTK